MRARILHISYPSSMGFTVFARVGWFNVLVRKYIYRVCVRVTNWRRTRSSLVRLRRLILCAYIYVYCAAPMGYIMGICAQVISYAEGVRLSSRLGRAIGDVSGRDRVCIYYNTFMRVCASVCWIKDACMYIIIYTYAQRLEDYTRRNWLSENANSCRRTLLSPRCVVNLLEVTAGHDAVDLELISPILYCRTGVVRWLRKTFMYKHYNIL